MATKLRKFRIVVGSRKRLVTVKARSRYEAKKKLLEVPGIAPGVRFEILRDIGSTDGR